MGFCGKTFVTSRSLPEQEVTELDTASGTGSEMQDSVGEEDKEAAAAGAACVSAGPCTPGPAVATVLPGSLTFARCVMLPSSHLHSEEACWGQWQDPLFMQQPEAPGGQCQAPEKGGELAAWPREGTGAPQEAC